MEIPCANKAGSLLVATRRIVEADMSQGLLHKEVCKELRCGNGLEARPNQREGNVKATQLGLQHLGHAWQPLQAGRLGEVLSSEQHAAGSVTNSGS